LPRQGLKGQDVEIFEMILDIIRENVEGIDTRDRAIRQLQYYVNNAKI